MKLTEAKLKKIVEEELKSIINEYGADTAAPSMMAGVKPQDVQEAMGYLKDIRVLMEQLTTGMDYLNAAILGDVPVDVTKGQKLIGRMLKKHGKGGLPAASAKEEPTPTKD